MELVMEIVLEEKSISSQVRARASLLRRPVQSRKKAKKPNPTAVVMLKWKWKDFLPKLT